MGARQHGLAESLTGGGTTLFGSSRTYDGVGSVATVNTTLAAGTDNQAFCYDEQNHLTWAGSTGTPPCTGTAITPGSLTSAQYNISYSYDAMNRLKATQLGSYSYGTGLPSSSPIHAAVAAGSNGQGGPYYSASYDAVGDMTCRAPTSATTCTGNVTGQQMTYDAERRLSHWQSSPSNPTSSADYLYDGSGQRVEQVGTSANPGTPFTCGEETQSSTLYLASGMEELSAQWLRWVQTRLSCRRRHC